MPNSAAGRLLAVIKKATYQQQSLSIFEMWAATFELAKDDRAAVFEAIASLHGLIAEAKKEVAAHAELKQDLYIGALTGIDNAVWNAALNGQWASYVAHFQGATLIALEFVAEQFDRLSPEQVLEPEELASLRASLDAVLEEVLASDIPPELATILIDKLNDARHALLMYQINGVQDLQRAADAAVGAAVLASDKVKAASGKKAVADYVAVVGQMLDLVTKAKPYLEILKPAVRALLSSGS